MYTLMFESPTNMARMKHRSAAALFVLIASACIVYFWLFLSTHGYSMYMADRGERYSDTETGLSTLPGKSLPSNDVTIVTAYFDLRSFAKGSIKKVVTAATYFDRASELAHMENPLVLYTDTMEFINMVTSLRRGKENKTKLFYMSRNSSWAFQNEPRITEILSAPDYPKHHPNTVVSGYSCAQHAKYDVIERAARADLFKTKYIAWLDVGYFRKRNSSRMFKLEKPDNFNDAFVAMTRRFKVSLNVTPDKIFLRNLVWVGGGLVLGERKRLILFAEQFRRTVHYFLSKGFVNTDQQVLYAMFSTEGRRILKPEVEIQLYKSSDWFYLGNKMLRELS